MAAFLALFNSIQGQFYKKKTKPMSSQIIYLLGGPPGFFGVFLDFGGKIPICSGKAQRCKGPKQTGKSPLWGLNPGISS